MARLTAYNSIVMDNLNLNQIFDGAYQSSFSKNFTYNNVFYDNVVEVDWLSSGSAFVSYFAGYNISYFDEYQIPIINSGTITGYMQFSDNKKRLNPDFTLEGINLSAPILYSQFQSKNPSDHIAALQQALSGKDDIIGSPFSDVLLSFDGNDSIIAGAGADVVFAGTGMDVLSGGEGNDTLHGGNGIDFAIYREQSKFYQVAIDASNMTVTDRSGYDGKDDLATDIEIIGFSDQKSLNTEYFVKTASLTQAQVSSLAELYIASFNRAPDSIGLSYWGSRLKDGMSLDAIAKSFFVQPETLATYPSTQSLDIFINKVYFNVLGRGPDQDGLKYWKDDITNGVISRDVFLLAIINGAKAASGSPEDKATLANKTKTGLSFSVLEGLNNVTWAADVMASVNETKNSLDVAQSKIAFYAMTATTGSSMELTVKVGSWDFL